MKKSELSNEIISVIIKSLSEPMKAALLSLPAYGEKLDMSKIDRAPYFAICHRTVVDCVKAELAIAGVDGSGTKWTKYCTITPLGVAVRQRLAA